MSKVQPVPDGYGTVTPYLTIKGAGDAIEFYKKAFGAEETVRMPGPGDSVMHAELRIGNAMLMLTEEFPDMGSIGPRSIGGTPVTIHLYVDDCDAWWKRAVDAGCEVIMPIDDMFWGDRYGQVADPFGHRWAISSHVEDVSEEEMGKRLAAMMEG